MQRLFVYQKERFPVVQNGIAVAVFTFSAISYSRISRGEEGFVNAGTYAIGCLAAFCLFFLVRIFDEFKDREDDARFRPYLPVPRGLVSLSELSVLGWILGVVPVILIALWQWKMLGLYALVLAYLLLMRMEFFVPRFLKSRQVLYITSHMCIFPLLDLYSSGLDWLLEDARPHIGLVFFFAVSYLNGLLVEIGRKLRAKEDEEPGVVSYTGLWGIRGAAGVWTALLMVTATCAAAASAYAGYGVLSLAVLGVLALACLVPLLRFVRKPSKSRARLVEIASGIWTIGMYLSLGSIPMIAKWMGV